MQWASAYGGKVNSGRRNDKRFIMARLYQPPNAFGVHRMEPAGSPNGELAGVSESNVVQFAGCNLPPGDSLE